jgi:ubiquinone biosynthesis protein UbiJ
MSATPAWLAAFESLLNRGLQASTQAAALARRLEATSLRVDIEGVMSIRASVTGGRLALVATEPQQPAGAPQADAVIAGSPLALLRLVRGQRIGGPGGADRASGAGGIGRGAGGGTLAQVRGDAELANSYRQLFGFAKPDVEEELSRIVGDLAARRLSGLARGAAGWVRRTRRTVGENLAEYLQEESRDLVGQPELDEFLHGVDVLRETADRVAARIAHLERRMQGSA